MRNVFKENFLYFHELPLTIKCEHWRGKETISLSRIYHSCRMRATETIKHLRRLYVHTKTLFIVLLSRCAETGKKHPRLCRIPLWMFTASLISLITVQSSQRGCTASSLTIAWWKKGVQNSPGLPYLSKNCRSAANRGRSQRTPSYLTLPDRHRLRASWTRNWGSCSILPFRHFH